VHAWVERVSGCPSDGAEVVSMAPSTPGPRTWEGFLLMLTHGCWQLAAASFCDQLIRGYMQVVGSRW